jgi:hypothetical protein
MSIYLNGDLDRRTFLGGIAASAALMSLGEMSSADDRPGVEVNSRTIDDEWKTQAEELAEELALEFQAAFAHRADPRRYPATDPSEFQKAVMAFADSLRAKRRSETLGRVAKQPAESPSARKARIKRLPAIDPHAKLSVAAQYEKHVKSRPSLISKKMLDEAFGGDVAKTVKRMKAATKSSAAPGAVTKLALQLLNFEVPNRQDPLGKDEVRLGGTQTNIVGTTSKAATLVLGDFKQGQKKTYNPPKLIAEYNLLLTDEYPKCGAFCFIPYEHDIGGGGGGVIEKAVNYLKDMLSKLIEEAAAKAGVALGTLIGSPAFGAILGEILSKVLGWLLNKFVELILKWINDDVFPVPVILPFKVSTPAIWANGATHGPTHYCQVEGNNGRWKWAVRWAKA